MGLRTGSATSVILLLSCAALATPDGYANHTCPDTFKQWSQTTSPSPSWSAPTFDTDIAGPAPLTYVVDFTRLLRFYSQDTPSGCTPGTGDPCAPTGGTCSRLKGCLRDQWQAPSSTVLHGDPHVVQLSPLPPSPPPNFVFLGGEDGSLYKIDLREPASPPTSLSADTRRGSCSIDRLLAAPAVQLYYYSNLAFRQDVDSNPGHVSDDVVFVVTSTRCEDTTHNRLIAYWASNLQKKWEFNGPRFAGEEVGPTRMGAGKGGCALDYGNNRLFCTTDAPPGSTQDTLWAFNTVNGQLLWSDNPGGAVISTPVQIANRLYVVSESGSLWAYNPAGDGLGGPSRLWTTPLMVASPGAQITRSLRGELAAGTWQGKLLVVDSNGKLTAVEDKGTSGSILWSITTGESAKWVSAPAVLSGPTQSVAFIGRDDGYLQMIDLDRGQPQGIIPVAGSSDPLSDPGIDTDPVTGHAVVVAGGETIARITAPLCSLTHGNPPPFCQDECSLPQGNPPNWDPNCVDGTCRTHSCRDPGWNPQYNPCRALTSPASSCLNNTCSLGGTCILSPDNVPDGTACDDGWPFAPGSAANSGAGTCRADAVPALVACTLPEGGDCDGLGLPRHKCVTKPSVCGSVGGGKCCVCNDGYGMNCNDRCAGGQCVSDLYAGCASGRNSACIAAGDRACGVGQTCCGSNTGHESSCATDLDCTAGPQGACLDLNLKDGDPTKKCYYQQCANLNDDPQHCGACGTDCGEYRNTSLACLDNTDCGTCTSDAQCGASGKCVDGTCGRCRADVSVAGQPACGVACTSDLACGGGKCTNGRCCASGTECVLGASDTCQPLRCQRLVNQGTCTGGVCAADAACVGPDAGQLAAAAQPGMCSLDFEFTNEADGTSQCRAYATNYGTGGDPSLVMIDQNGTVTFYPASPADSTHLNGVAVSRDGTNLFAAMVNNGGGTPGLALRSPGMGVYSRIATAAATGGVDDNPFDQAAFNKGPVGPAFDDATFNGNLTRKVWLGNFKCNPLTADCACGDTQLCRLDDSTGTWRATPESFCNQACTDPSGRCYSCSGSGRSTRITAIAFQRRPALLLVDQSPHRFVILGHTNTLSFIDLDAGSGTRQVDVNLTNPAVYTPTPGRGDSTIEAILSIDPQPSGDVILEVRGAGDQPAPGDVKNTWLVHVDPADLSCRHELDVQRSSRHVNPCVAGSCPVGLTCSDGVCLKPCGTCPTGFTCLTGLCHIDGEVPATFGVGSGSALTVGPSALLAGGNGRLASMPSGKLLRWETAVDQVPVGFSEYVTAPSGPIPCDDGDACTVDSFVSGQCQHVAVNCADQNLCTVDACSPLTGQCTHAPANCDDGQVCTADTCDPATGACQHVTIFLSEPSPVQFTSANTLQWPATPDATEWNTYRGTIPALGLASRPPGAQYDQTCFEDGDAQGNGPTTTIDSETPPLGTGFYYLVSGKAGCESILGRASSGKIIANASPCP
jgi:outer membrane protein assembly factor BamB